MPCQEILITSKSKCLERQEGFIQKKNSNPKINGRLKENKHKSSNDLSGGLQSDSLKKVRMKQG